jgi:hypothetical protein
VGRAAMMPARRSRAASAISRPTRPATSSTDWCSPLTSRTATAHRTSSNAVATPIRP